MLTYSAFPTGKSKSTKLTTVEIADLSGQTIPFSFSVDGNSHLYYNPNDSTYTQHTSQSGVFLYTSADSNHRVTSVTLQQLASDIASQIRTALGNASMTENGECAGDYRRQHR